MIPVNLKLSNFTSYGDNPPELAFTSFKMAAISGLNGAGKSSLLDAITWCIWGSSRAGDSSDALVHAGTSEMFVQFSFELDEHLYIIKRKRTKKGGGSTALELWSNKHNLTEGTIKATQEKIINTLHLTFETFTNSSFLRQGHADEFTTKGPTDRKRILADILGLNHYDKLEEKAKEKAKEAQTQITLLDYQILEIEAELSQKEDHQLKLQIAKQKISQTETAILSLERQLESLKAQKTTLTLASEQQLKLKKSLEENQAELQDILLQGKKRAQLIKDLETALLALPEIEQKLASLKEIQLQAEKLKKIRHQRLEIEKELMQKTGSLNLKKEQQQNLQERIEEIDAQIKDLGKKGAKCPTCGQEIAKDQKHKVSQEQLKIRQTLEQTLHKIDIKEEQIQINKLNKQLDSIPFDSKQFESILKDLSDLDQLQIKKEQLLQDRATLDAEKKAVADLRTLYQNRAQAVKKIAQELKSLPDLTDKLQEITLKTSEQEMEINNLKLEEKDARNLLGQISQLISRTAQMEKLLAQKQADRLKLQKEKQIFEELALAFGKKGIQAMIIESAIPEIEDEANRLLEKLTDGRMKASFETQRETKTKIAGAEGIKDYATIETLDIIISDEMGERAYENYSGGEQFRVNFAIRLAISKLLTNRAGAKLQFLVIDEGFGTQDQAGRARLVEVIDTIKDDFAKILIITHLEELKEEFPVRIEVSKTGVGSTFEIVGG